MNNHYDIKELTEIYAEYRPKYSDEISDAIMKYFKDHQTSNKTTQNQFDMLLDVGCGSGQATEMFAPYFKEVIAIDISPNQIELGRQRLKHFKNVTFKVAAGEDIPLEDKSVDLIVCGIAAHWLDLELFFKEAERVLKPNGCMAIFAYSVPYIWPINKDLNEENDHKSDIIHDEIKNQVSKIQMSKEHKRGHDHYWNNYAEIFEEIPFCRKERNTNISLKVEWSMDQIIGYLKSVHLYHQDQDKNFNSICSFSDQIKKDWKIENAKSDEKIAKVIFDVFILLATE